MLIAITGANGFVGNHLKKHLLERGYKVRLLQRLSGQNAFQIEDFSNFENWQLALSDVDVLIHCAAKVHDLNQTSKKYYEFYDQINVKITETLGLEAVKANVKRIIFLSTLKVNGEKTEISQPFDNLSIPDPKDNYALSKFKAEQILRSISKRNNIEVVIVRPPLVYGPNVKSNFLSLIKILNYGMPLPFLSIRNKRSIIYVENLVSFITTCISSELASNEIFLVSDLTPISTPDLMTLISKELKGNSKLFKFPVILIKILSYLIFSKDKFDKLIDNLEIDSRYSCEKLNWSPPFSTKQGIKKTVSWFKEKKLKN